MIISLPLLVACVTSGKPDPDSASPDSATDSAPEVADDTADPAEETGDPCIDEQIIGFLDADGDGHGDADAPLTACDELAGVEAADDCDDGDAAVYPGATETCDGRDEDCDGEIDEDLGDLWYADADGDGHGDPATGAVSCAPDASAVAVGDDCDDAEPLAWTDAEEICGDGVDNDCDGQGCPLSGDLDETDALLVHTGIDVWDYVGLGVAPAGDWDGDGLDDLFLGASLRDATGRDSGAVYVVTASVGGSVSGAIASAVGPHADADMGQTVAAVGDVTGDGRVDLLAGVPSYIAGMEFVPGEALLYDGATGSTLDEHTAYIGGGNYENFSYAMTDLDDVNGDGSPDFLIGALTHGYLEGTNQGAVYLVNDAPGGKVDVGDAGWQLLGCEGCWAGGAVAKAGDLDGDGVIDALIGSQGTGETAVWVVTGGWADADLDDVADARLAPESSTDTAGTAVASAGDVDGDGYADALIGGYAEATNGTWAGAAWLALGPLSGDRSLADADAKILGEHASAFAGISVAGLWDQDGDGGSEIVVGARQDKSGGSNAGAVFILPGSTRGTVETSAYWTKIVGSAGSLVGQRVVDAGDADGDGLSDLWISGPGYDSHRGGVFLYSLMGL